jgi:hypothetical protein
MKSTMIMENGYFQINYKPPFGQKAFKSGI